MAQTELNIAMRDRVGKGGSRSQRRQGLIPAIVYGKGMEPCPITVSPKELHKAIDTKAGWNILITLKGEGALDGKVVILKDMQRDPIRQEALHADFQAIDLKQEFLVMVPLHPVGRSEGEKAGGNLQVVRHEIEVACLPTAIPEALEVDVTALNVGDVLHVEDLPLPAGVEIPHDVNFTVITVTGRKGEEEEAAEEAEEAPEA